MHLALHLLLVLLMAPPPGMIYLDMLVDPVMGSA